jgi:hypothetical protein
MTTVSFGLGASPLRLKNRTPIRKSSGALDFASQAPIFPTTDPRLSGEIEI